MAIEIIKTRRDVLKAGVALSGAIAGLALGGATLGEVVAFAGEPERMITPGITIGPFYPVTKPLEKDADLTMLAGHKERAKGEILHVMGRVLNRNGDPVRNARVELWQANAAGRYTHPSDPNKAPLDPNFQGYGEQTTDAEGRFHFKTVKPGAYPGLYGARMRTPHIHFEIWGKYDRMATQLFFPGEPLNEQDAIFQGIPNNREGVIAKLQKNVEGTEPGATVATWDVVLLQG